MPPKKDEISDQRLERLRKFTEDIEFPDHKVTTRKDVQALTEKVINGILMGVIKRDKAAPLGVMLPLAYKMAKELEGVGSGVSPGLSVSFKQTEQTVTLQMSEEEMDAYLGANERVKVEILEKMQSDGKISMGKPEKKIVQIESKVDPKKVKTDLDGIVQISRHTDLPLDKDQARTLFGRNLNDKRHVMPEALPDMTGFGGLFEEKNVKKIAPEGAIHQWKGKYEPNGGLAQLWYTCTQCGLRQPNVDKEFCKGKHED